MESIKVYKIYDYRKNGWYRKLDICKEMDKLDLYNTAYVSLDKKYILITGENYIYAGEKKLVGIQFACGAYDTKNKKWLIAPCIDFDYIESEDKFYKVITALDEEEYVRLEFYSEEFETLLK